MATKITRTIKLNTVNVTFMNTNYELETATAINRGNKISFSEIANQLSIDENNICEVEITDDVREIKTEMDTATFILYAFECKEDEKRKSGFFYRNIKSTVYLYRVYDINEKKLVTIQTVKEMKIGKIVDGYKVMALLEKDEKECMYKMSETDWRFYAKVME